MSDVGAVLEVIREEYEQARTRWPALNTRHEGYAVILEEMDELWDAVKCQDAVRCFEEAVQVGAMVVAFLVEVVGD
jgi:hypothetical protein